MNKKKSNSSNQCIHIIQICGVLRVGNHLSPINVVRDHPLRFAQVAWECLELGVGTWDMLGEETTIPRVPLLGFSEFDGVFFATGSTSFNRQDVWKEIGKLYPFEVCFSLPKHRLFLKTNGQWQFARCFFPEHSSKSRSTCSMILSYSVGKNCP